MPLKNTVEYSFYISKCVILEVLQKHFTCTLRIFFEVCIKAYTEGSAARFNWRRKGFGHIDLLNCVSWVGNCWLNWNLQFKFILLAWDVTCRKSCRWQMLFPPPFSFSISFQELSLNSLMNKIPKWSDIL